MGTFNVSLKTLTERVSLEVVYTPKELDQINVEIAEVNRPGLFLAGYYDYFDKLRLQIMGLAEMNFLSGLSAEKRYEAVKRGHRLVADDAVELRKVSNRQIMGTAPENIRHFIELRGIGIVNVARVFGVGAVKLSESLDLVVQLEAWDPTKNYQRTGLENEYYDILGVSIPSTSIPVSPGRNLAVVLETAAINNRQKKMGYNAAKELLIRLGLDDKLD